jgi:hypothetical protein
MKAIYEASENANQKAGCSIEFKALAGGLHDFERGLQLKLAGSSAGRIVLHLVLAVATWHFAWHFQGIARELTRH